MNLGTGTRSYSPVAGSELAAHFRHLLARADVGVLEIAGASDACKQKVIREKLQPVRFDVISKAVHLRARVLSTHR